MQKKLTPLKAIRKKCLECSNGQIIEVRLCPVKDCAIYAYRMGHMPDVMPTYEVKDISEEERAKRRENFMKIRERQKGVNKECEKDEEDINDD